SVSDGSAVTGTGVGRGGGSAAGPPAEQAASTGTESARRRSLAVTSGSFAAAKSWLVAHRLLPRTAGEGFTPVPLECERSLCEERRKGWKGRRRAANWVARRRWAAKEGPARARTPAPIERSAAHHGTTRIVSEPTKATPFFVAPRSTSSVLALVRSPFATSEGVEKWRTRSRRPSPFTSSRAAMYVPYCRRASGVSSAEPSPRVSVERSTSATGSKPDSPRIAT